MDFKLVLYPRNPDEFILYAEKPLSGLKFIEVASACLKRNLDGITNTKHITLGNVAKYEISVPQSIAIQSGWFTEKSVRYLPCEANILADYLFYGAAMNNASACRSVYPYYQYQVVMNCYVDELGFIQAWVDRGYPDEMTRKLDSDVNLPIIPDSDKVEGAETGDIVLDDLLR